MARETSIDQTGEYDDFIARLQAFHDERGTNFDPAPKVGNRRVDLLRLYRRVVGDGGYDVVSDTKQSKLAWRKIGQDFNLGTTNLPALAFNLKTAYYKNLAAYEIVDVHKRVPPPKEILEMVSAKGGDLLHRTADNYSRPLGRDDHLGNGMDHDDSESEAHRTPNNERMEVEDGETLGARTMRGLRQAPPQRVLFQNDVPIVRPTRQPSQHASPAPQPSGLYSAANGLHHLNGVPSSLANYEPKQQVPLTLRPVVTPGNNPELFKANQKQLRDAYLARTSRTPLLTKGMMLPGTGFTGPNIYIRTLLALQSGVMEEQEYALHHLVKISHERGDKYRFDSFPGLAEALIAKALEISSLTADVEWTITYQGDEALSDDETLDGINGTPDILLRIPKSRKRKFSDRVETDQTSRRLTLINEASLVMRNMVMLEENAEYLSKLPAIRDAIVIILSLPRLAPLTELRQYFFEIAEQLTRYYPPRNDDPLFQCLLDNIDSPDRGHILSSLRAISRIGSQLQQSVHLHEVPVAIVQKMCEWILVEDEDLRASCLDFLYQYTVKVENVETLLQNVHIEGVIKQLVRLLLHNARTETRRDTPPKIPSKPTPSSHLSQSSIIPPDYPIPRIPTELIEQLLTYDEPERSSQWLRTCFEEDSSGEVTQIALWQAYQIPFAPFASQRPLLPAKDFITNVSSTFSTASAQVMNGPTPRFVIKGIKARQMPVDPKGRPYMRCIWHLEDGSECGEFAQQAKSMWEHIVSAHLGLPKDENGKRDFTPKLNQMYSCRWSDCKKFQAKGQATSAFAVGMHLKTHLADSSDRAIQRMKHNRTEDREEQSDVEAKTWPLRNTQTDERNDAAGLPLTSALVLRNLARNLPKTTTGTTAGQEDLVWRMFAAVHDQLYFVMAHNQSLREYLPVLTQAVVATQQTGA